MAPLEKDWKDGKPGGTPVDAASLEDLEARINAEVASRQVASAALAAIAELAPNDGDMLVYGEEAWERIAAGDPGQVLRIDSLGRPVWRDEMVNVEDWGAIPDDFFTDGKATSGSATFTSATAKFTAADVGKNIFILRAGASSQQDHHTTIKEVKGPTEIVLNNNAGRNQEQARFYLSRAGVQTSAFDAADAEAVRRGGAKILCPGVGYLVESIKQSNRVGHIGMGKRSTCLHQAANSNAPLIYADYTSGNSAIGCSVENLWLDGNRGRQSDLTTKLSAEYKPGNSTIKLESSAGFLPVGIVVIGTNRIHYTGISGNELTGCTGGLEDTTDAVGAVGATVTHKRGHGIYYIRLPFASGGAYEEAFDSHHRVVNCTIKNFKGDGLSNWGQSDVRVIDNWALYCDEYGYRPSFDTNLTDNLANNNGRSGYYSKGSSTSGAGNKAFENGGVTPDAGHGFMFEGDPNPSTPSEGSKAWVGCNSQDNKANGYYCRNAERLAIQGTASSNGRNGPVGTYVGLKLDGCQHSIFDITSTERGVDNVNFWQQHALYMLATTRPTTENQIRITHGASGGTATVGKAIKPESVETGSNNILINGMGGTATVAYAAEVTPDPYAGTVCSIAALTGNVVIKAPANAHKGCPLTIILLQDATGGRTVTWNAAFNSSKILVNTAANGLTVLEFFYDGATWQYTASADQAHLGSWTFLDHGLTCCTVDDPQDATTGIGPEGGKPMYFRCKVLKDTDFSTLYYIVSQAATEQLKDAYVAVYNKAGERLGASEKQDTAWKSNGEKATAIKADEGKSLVVKGGSDEYVWIQFMCGTQGTTPANFRASNGASAISNFAMVAKGKRLRCGTTGTAKTTPPASFNPVELAVVAGPIMAGA